MAKGSLIQGRNIPGEMYFYLIGLDLLRLYRKALMKLFRIETRTSAGNIIESQRVLRVDRKPEVIAFKPMGKVNTPVTTTNDDLTEKELFEDIDKILCKPIRLQLRKINLGPLAKRREDEVSDTRPTCGAKRQVRQTRATSTSPTTGRSRKKSKAA